MWSLCLLRRERRHSGRNVPGVRNHAIILSIRFFTISRPIPLDAPMTIATLVRLESASHTRPSDEADHPSTMFKSIAM
jgi:hypothetical protein